MNPLRLSATFACTAAATTLGSATIPKSRSTNATTYSAEELAPWASRIRNAAANARNVFVVTNNHYLGKAVVNALQLLSMLQARKIKVPEPLRQHYPELEAIADTPPVQPTLFPLANS